MIPISTALYDPKWYYNGHQGHFYKDRNGVYNGLRADILNPPKTIGGECGKDCGKQIPCNFMLNYKKYLNDSWKNFFNTKQIIKKKRYNTFFYCI